MVESSQSSEPPSKDPVRIVYHAQNRTFARLFKERSLDQVKDVVRHKLGLGPEIDISLKQMGPDALLDLDDDDDFQAFRVLVGSSISVDVQVTVGESQIVSLPPVAPQLREQPSAAAPPASLSQATAYPKTASVTKSSVVAQKSQEASIRKRKVSFDDTTIAAPDKHTERHKQSKLATATPASSAKAAEASAKSTHAEEPPKKKQKKAVAKKSRETKPKVVKSTAPDHGTEGSGGEPSELPAKQRKKDATIVPSAPHDTDGVNQPISQPDSISGTNRRLPSERHRISAAEGRESKSHQSEKRIGVCAAIPRTSASADVQSELVAAILALSKGTESVPPPPPAKRKAIKKDAKKSSGSPGASLSKSTTISAPFNETPNVPSEQRHHNTIMTNESPPQTRELQGLPCPICLEEPFHIRYRCPTVLKGADALRKRLDEVKKSNTSDQQPLIKELENLLRDAEAALESPSKATPPCSRPLDASVSPTPNIPSNSHLSEVTVENTDEGGSSESSDEMPEGRNEHSQKRPVPMEQKTPGKRPSPPNDVLEAIIRGPALRQQSILHVLDRIVGDEDDKDTDTDTDSEEDELEGDPEKEIDRSSSRLSKHVVSSSSSETEEGESMSPSPSLLAGENPVSDIQDSSNHAEKLPCQPGSDVVMGDCVDPSILRSQDDDSSEETHVGSEDRMVVDDAVVKKAVVTSVEEQLCPRSRTLRLPGSSIEPCQSGETEVDIPVNGRAAAAPKAPVGAGVDPIEPADDLEPATTSRESNSDPIEALPEDMGLSSTGITQPTPKPGVAKRIKNRDGQILDDEAEQPILVQELALQITEKVTPLPTKGKLRKRTDTPASREQSSARRRTRSTSLLSTSTPAAVALLNHRAKVGGQSTKTPAKRSDQRADGSCIAPSPVVWETLAEPPSPSQQLDEPSVGVDELISSSPQPEDAIPERLNVKEAKNAPRTPALSSAAKTSREKERLFDLTSSQIPFPYSQHKANPAPTSLTGKQEVATESDSDPEAKAKATKKKAKAPGAYRPLSQLASQAVLFSPSLLTPTNKSATGTKTRKRAADKDPSSSSSSDEDDANNSMHIPRGRRAGAKLETKRRKSLLSRV